MWKNAHGPKFLIGYNKKPKMSGRTSPPGKISSANDPPCSSIESLWLQTTIGERKLKEGPWERGESKKGLSIAPVPQNIQAGNKPATAMLREPQGESAMPKARTKARMPMLRASIAKGSQCKIAEKEGGGNMTRDDTG
jgi:hypothetical protein